MVKKDTAEILIVEDSPTQAEDLRYTLEKGGYNVRVARNGREALDAMQQKSPTIVITDIVMPVMDGFQLCKKIKEDERYREIPVILLTALSEPEDVLRGLECGADNFITKPYNGQYLLARIHNVLINDELRKGSKMQMGAEIFFKGQKYFITSERQQILDLLLSTYETAVMKNGELRRVQGELESLNEGLENKVEERTAALKIEIEERRIAEEKVRRLNAELEQRVAQRTAQLESANKELESFSYSVSHDLKAPLRIIHSFSDIIMTDYSDKLDDDGKRLFSSVRDNAKKMARLIDDILAFSRAGRRDLRLGRINMQSVVKEVIGELTSAETGRDISFQVGELSPAAGDLAAIRQVLSNLLSNAVKFTRFKKNAVIEVGCSNEAEEIVYFVRDNGAGFDPAYSDKLFGIFQRLHSEKEFEGTGIGLAIVKRIVTKLGGRVWAEGKIDGGATFYFTLPKSDT